MLGSEGDIVGGSERRAAEQRRCRSCRTDGEHSECSGKGRGAAIGRARVAQAASKRGCVRGRDAVGGAAEGSGKPLIDGSGRGNGHVRFREPVRFAGRKLELAGLLHLGGGLGADECKYDRYNVPVDDLDGARREDGTATAWTVNGMAKEQRRSANGVQRAIVGMNGCYYFPYVDKVVTQTLGQPLQPQVGRCGGGWPVIFSGRCRTGQKVGCMCPGMG